MYLDLLFYTWAINTKLKGFNKFRINIDISTNI